MENLERIEKQSPISEEESNFKNIREYLLRKSVSNQTSFEALVNLGASNYYQNLPTK